MSPEMARFYIDGVKVGEKQLEPGELAPGAQDAGIWLARAQTTANRTLRGRMQEVAIYDYALSAQRVKEHYERGNPATPPVPYDEIVLADNPTCYFRLGEASGNAKDELAGPDGTYAGTPYAQGQPSLLPNGDGTSVNFAAGTARIEVPDNPATRIDPTQSFSIECWVKYDQAVQFSGLIENGGSQAFVFGMYVQGLLAARIGSLFIPHSGTETGSGGTLATPIAVGEAWHLVAVFDKATGQRSVYANGGHSFSIPLNAAAYAANAGGLIIAQRRGAIGTTYCLRGNVQEVALYDHALTAQQVANHYQAGGGTP